MKELLNSLFKDDISLRKIESSVYSVIPEAQSEHHYDSKANIYDAIIGNSFYNRLFWGNPPDNYRAFCRTAVNSDNNGAILDVGCGSLVFTHKVYAAFTARPLILLDRSLSMLLKGKQRLLSSLGKIPDNIVFVHADALSLPFKSGALKTVISFGLLHIFEKPEVLLTELMRIRSEDGSLFATSLVANNRLGEWYLTSLKRAGEIGNVQSDNQLYGHLSSHYPQLQLNSIGNMAYIGLQARHVEPASWADVP
jgi:ubiquinone/menaquinone biosynthesis C-methylase UbiE